MAQVMEDVVVLLPGILGSVLHKGGADIWGLSRGTIARALWHFGENITDLALPRDQSERGEPDDGVTATRLLPDTHLVPFFWKVDGYSLLARTLTSTLKLLDLSDMLRSFPSVYQLLPTYACYDPGGGGLVHLNEVAGIPNLDPLRVAKAFEFHEEIRKAVEKNAEDEEYRRRGYRTYPIVGIFQPTYQSALWDGDSVKPLREFRGRDDGGDGTVPRGSATPLEMEDQTDAVFAAARHASLQNLKSTLAQLHGLISAREFDPKRYRGAASPFGIDIDDAYATDEPITLRVRAATPRVLLLATITDTDSGVDMVSDRPVRGRNNHLTAEFPPLPEGSYRVTVREADGKGEPLSDLFVVLQS